MKSIWKIQPAVGLSLLGQPAQATTNDYTLMWTLSESLTILELDRRLCTSA